MGVKWKTSIDRGGIGGIQIDRGIDSIGRGWAQDRHMGSETI